MKILQLFVMCIFCIAAWSALAGNEAVPDTGRLYAEFNWHLQLKIHRNSIFSGSDEYQDKIVDEDVTGSYWSLRGGSQNLLVTAAHVLGINKKQEFKQIGEYAINDQNVLKTLNVRALLGTLSFEIAEVGFINEQDDIVFMKPDKEIAFAYVNPFKLTEIAPKLGSHVTAIGHPGTAASKHDTDIVVDSVDAKVIILNKPLDHGYSGGLICDENSHTAYGVIVSVSDKQTFVQRLTPRMLGDIHWTPASDAFMKKF